MCIASRLHQPAYHAPCSLLWCAMATRGSKLAALVLMAGCLGGWISGCGSGSGSQGGSATTVGSSAVACGMLEDIQASVNDPTARWVAEGKPSSSAARTELRVAFAAQPARYAAAAEVAPPELRDEFDQVVSAARGVTDGDATKADSDLLAASLWAANESCKSVA